MEASKIEITNRPNCKKCERPAITLVNKMWLCGDCLIGLQKKVDELKEKLLLEG